MPTPETLVVNACMEWLSYKPNLGYFYRTNNIPPVQYVKGEMVFRKMPKYAAKGMADITGVLRNGIACFIECKAGKAKLSADQIEFQRKVIGMGAVYIVARGVDDLVAAFATFPQAVGPLAVPATV